MKQFNLKNMGRRTILAALVALLGVGNAMAAGTLSAINIGTGTVTLPIDYDHCQTDYNGKIKDGHFDSMNDTNYALYELNNTGSAGAFDIVIQAGTQKNDVTVTFQILDGSDAVVSTATTSTMTQGDWANKIEYKVTLAGVPAGTSKLKIVFNSSSGGYTANIHQINMTPSGATTYTVTASVAAGEGTISGAGTFAEGSNVTLTATPKWGYQFKEWDVNGTKSSENPYTISSLAADATVTATFESGDAYFLQNVPGSLDIYKTNLSGGNISSSGYWENNYNDHTITYLINVTTAGVYTFIAGIGTKKDGVTINAKITDSSDAEKLNKTLDVTNNGSWSNFDNKYTWTCQLDPGKYTLVFTTHISSSNTLNLKDVTVKNDANVTCTIPTSGVGTFCSEFPLDFTGTGVDAYIITGNIVEGAIEATRVNDVVPARTGIIVKGTAGAHSINVSAAATANVDGNELVGVTAETTVNPATGNSYYVMNGGKLHPVTTSGTISANHAYLKIAEGGSAPLFLIFGDETTGINKVVLPTSNDGVFYDLQGRRVAQPTKGLYIVNGKKVIMK